MSEGTAIVVAAILTIFAPPLFYFCKWAWNKWQRQFPCPKEAQRIVKTLLKNVNASRVYIAVFLYGDEKYQELGLRPNSVARAICEITDRSVPKLLWKYQNADVGMWGSLIKQYQETGRNYFPNVLSCPEEIPKQLMLARGAFGACGSVILKGDKIIGVVGADFAQTDLLNEEIFLKVKEAANQIAFYL